MVRHGIAWHGSTNPSTEEMTVMSYVHVTDDSGETRRYKIVVVNPPPDADKKPVRVRVVRDCGPGDLRCLLDHCRACQVVAANADEAE